MAGPAAFSDIMDLKLFDQLEIQEPEDQLGSDSDNLDLSEISTDEESTISEE
jgi:hypothetical protein